MAFKRNIQPEPRPDDARLLLMMAGIGMNFASHRDSAANIEDTLIYASELGMDEYDLRVLSVLTTWLGVHHAYINADRLVKVIAEHPSERVRAYWSAIADWLERDRRLARLRTDYQGPRLDILPAGTDFQISRKGEDSRFLNTALRVPDGVLRERASDVLPPEVLVQRHPGYRNRVLMGPSWRADVWTALERAPELSVAEAARASYASFATAWEVLQAFKLFCAGSEPQQNMH